jgi:lysylphosphatidylglycerol synthetase-like protein (DUF2156 family)
MSDAAVSAESKGSFTATLLAAVGGFSIFLIILVIAYLPNKAAPAGDGVKTPAERKAALAELRGKEQTAATTYGWVDKDKGVVRLPLERAVELTIQEAKK